MSQNTYSIDRVHAKVGDDQSPINVTVCGFYDDLSFSEEQYQECVRTAFEWFSTRFGIRAEKVEQDSDTNIFLVYEYEGDDEPSFVLRPYRYETSYRAISGSNKGGKMKVVELVLTPLRHFKYGGTFVEEYPTADRNGRYIDMDDPSNLEIDTLHYGYKIIDGPNSHMIVPFRSREPSRTNSWGRYTQSNYLDHPDCTEEFCGQEDISGIDRPVSDNAVHTSLTNVWRVGEFTQTNDHDHNLYSLRSKYDNKGNNMGAAAILGAIVIVILVVIILVWAGRSTRR
jgi:hypothetical protein